MNQTTSLSIVNYIQILMIISLIKTVTIIQLDDKFTRSSKDFKKIIEQMAKLNGCKTKTSYPYEYFGHDTYDEIICNLTKEDWKSSLSNKLPKKRRSR